jgi:hypothetical protein
LAVTGVKKPMIWDILFKVLKNRELIDSNFPLEKHS